MNNIKETIKKDIEHIFGKMEKLRIEYPWAKLSSQDDKKEPDFRPYRSMANCLIDTFNNYKYMTNHLVNTDNEFISKFIKKLTYEIKELHETMEQYKEGYQQFKCLNDVFIKLTRLSQNIKEQIADSITKLYKQIYKQETQKRKLYEEGYTLEIKIIKEKEFTDEQISNVKKLLEELFPENVENKIIDIDITGKNGERRTGVILMSEDEIKQCEQNKQKINIILKSLED